MKTLVVELPNSLAEAVDRAVREGGFYDAGELTREALREFLTRSRYAMIEQHQLEDIAAAVHETSRSR